MTTKALTPSKTAAKTAAPTIEQREASLAEAQRKLKAEQARLAAERAEHDARIAEAQRKAEASVLDGIEAGIRARRIQQIEAQQALDAMAGAEVLDLNALAVAFDAAANAAARLRGYQQSAYDALGKAGLDQSIADDGISGITTQTQHRHERNAEGTLVPVYDEAGQAVMETITIRRRPAQHEGIPFSQYLDRVVVHRQHLAQIAGGDDLTQALAEARQTAATAA